MIIEQHEYSTLELQRALNECKDMVIGHLNAEHGTHIDPLSVLVVLRSRGCLGKAWDFVMGKLDPSRVAMHIIKVANPPKKNEEV